MSQTQTVDIDLDKGRGRFVQAFRRRPSILALVLLTLALMAVFGPMLAPQGTGSVDLGQAFQAPSADYFFGTDSSGRDIFSRILSGARSSLVAPLIVTVIAALLGTLIAVVSAWNGGWIDSVFGRAVDILFSFPGLLLAILACAIFGTGLTAAVIALSIAYIPYIARIVRSASIREMTSPYLEALRLQGFSGFLICRRHLLPNVASVIGAQAAITFGYAMVDLAAINFLGLGQDATSPNWGVMVASGQSAILRGRPEEALFAGLAIVIAVVAVNLLGSRLERDASLEIE